MVCSARCSCSSRENTRSMSSIMMKFSSTRYIPCMKFVLYFVPMDGDGSMLSSEISSTSRTASTSAPSMIVSPSSSKLRTIMHVSTVSSVAGMENLILRSTTGSTFPRRFITPFM